MLDQRIYKIFGVFFWLGLAAILASFFYDRWFVITVVLGFILMLIGFIAEGVKLTHADTFTSLIMQNKEKMVYRILLGFITIAIVIYFLYARTYQITKQYYDLISSPLNLTLWVFILAGLTFGAIVLFIFAKARGLHVKEKPKLTKEKVVKKEVKEPKKEKPRGRGFFTEVKERIVFNVKDIKIRFVGLFSKKAAKKTEEKVQEKEKKEGKKEKKPIIQPHHYPKIYKHVTIISYCISVFILVALLIINRKAKIPFLNWYAWITLAVLAGLFTGFVFLKIYRNIRKRRQQERESKIETLKAIKESVIARASKYKTNIDKVYELVEKR
ncbi:MAG: hypothetical protein QW404_00885, partial [Candidatus Nanoarchaeia archaeon]